ncbi:hypothetical protein, partial [Streptomyces sp. NPDC058398]|uniref:hypothetical protein n=1 Tax=Streptomyces sp. NPDC058398 TaxID=3346479 RepID=UPI00366869D5
DDLTDASGSAPDALTTDPAVARRRAQVAAHALTVRRAIGRRPAPPTAADAASQELPRAPGTTTPPARSAAVLTALEVIDSQLDVLSALFGPPPTLTSDAPTAAAG